MQGFLFLGVMMCLWAQPAWINPYAQHTLVWDAELETGVKA
jgi:hypothetical protein